MHRVASSLIVLLALGVFAAAGWVVSRNSTVPDAGQVLPVPRPASSAGLTGGSSPSGGSASGGSTAGASGTATGSGQVVAFLGDDWTAGIGASGKSARFPNLLAAQLGFRERNFGADGTGYATSTDSDGDYASRVDDVVKTDPDVVVVSGGRNDFGDSDATVRTDARMLFASLHEKLPNARLIAIAPFWGDSDRPAELDPIAAAVEKGVTAVGGTYLDITDPVHGHPSWMSDSADPNDKGYAGIADALAPKLAPLLSGS